MKKLAGFLMFAASLVPLQASELILNGGFETRDFTSWDVFHSIDQSNLFIGTTPVNSGQFAAFFAAGADGEDLISETFETIPGESYTFSFFLEGQFGSEEDKPDARFIASWNETNVLDTSPITTTGFGFTKFTFTEIGTGLDTISFDAFNASGSYGLDDVSVQGPAAASTAPEPAAFGLVLMGLAIGILIRAFLKRRLSQSK